MPANEAPKAYDLTPEVNTNPWLILMGWADTQVEKQLRGEPTDAIEASD
jgi:hypothetical protein